MIAYPKKDSIKPLGLKLVETCFVGVRATKGLEMHTLTKRDNLSSEWLSFESLVSGIAIHTKLKLR